MRHRMKRVWWALAIAVAAVAAPATASAQCRGCEGTRCLLGCPVGDPTNCGYNCIDWRSPDGGAGCISDATGCNLGLLDGAGSIVVPTLRLAERDSGLGLFQFTGQGRRLDRRFGASPPLSGEQILLRPCDLAIVHRSYAPAVAEEKRTATELVVL
jgi:hypothetical protein